MASLTPLHTFALPADAQQVHTIRDAKQLLDINWQTPFYILGQGSNTLFVEDFNGQIIVMALTGISISEQNDMFELSVAGGENWHQLVCWCLQQGVYGFENLALIPGTVGAAPVQNIGAYGVEVAQFISKVHGFNIETQQFVSLDNEACQFAYRDSIFKQQLFEKFIITQVDFVLPKRWRANTSYGPLQQLNAPTAQQVFDAVIAVRASKLPDPNELPNAGSFFKNPIVARTLAESLQLTYPSMPFYDVDEANVKLAAGWLIEQAGLKGFQIGGVRVHDKQALVLVNDGNSCGADVLNMVRHIQRTVFDKFEVMLEHEVRLVGCNGLITLSMSDAND